VNVRIVMGALVLCACLPCVAASATKYSPEQNRFREAIQEGVVQADHVASIGEYQYNVYIDKSTNPMVVFIDLTDESRRALTSVENVNYFDEQLDRQGKLEKQYRKLILEGRQPADINLVGLTRSFKKAKKAKTSAVEQPEDIKACVKFFPEEDRSKSHNLYSNTDIAINADGLPWHAQKIHWVAPIKVNGSQTCQDKVAGWGMAGDQGGHLIGAAMGGPRERANLTPQNGTLNQGQWNRIENTARYCIKRGYFPVTETIIVTYRFAPPWVARPYSYTAELEAERPQCPTVTHWERIYVPNDIPTAFTIQQMDVFVDDMTYFCTHGKPKPPEPGDEPQEARPSKTKC
jgi:hypothetical protein